LKPCCFMDDKKREVAWVPSTLTFHDLDVIKEWSMDG
jgi:hypothetical protein